jgi:hypothetical protein
LQRDMQITSATGTKSAIDSNSLRDNPASVFCLGISETQVSAPQNRDNNEEKSAERDGILSRDVEPAPISFLGRKIK